MDPDPRSPSPRKVRFAPKGPPRRKATVSSTAPKSEVNDINNAARDDHAAQEDAYLLQRFKEKFLRGTKTDNKPQVQVAFGPESEQSSSRSTYSKPKEGASHKNNGLDSNTVGLPLTDEIGEDCSVSVDGSLEKNKKKKKKKKEYIEPWDYHHSDYPISLPLRRPYSGDPELLDEAEFGDKADLGCDENLINAASELGLREQNDEVQMLFLQLPKTIPSFNSTASTSGEQKSSESRKGKEIMGSSESSGEGIDFPRRRDNVSKKGRSLEELPAGYMGKMLVYKSGAIKLKLGDTLYDVSPGTESSFAQEFAAVNTVDKHYCVLGEVNKKVVITPDFDSILDSDLG